MKKPHFTWRQCAQVAVVLGCALALKLFYATASADALRWILTPTTALVEAVTGVPFVYEAHAGYLSRERGFLIAASCAGVNFLFIAFLVVTLPRLWRGRLAWRFVPVAAVLAYLVTLMANAARICLALWWPRVPGDWLTHAQLHRCEGIMVYFGFLLLLFVVSERMRAETTLVFPLLLYYAATLGLPLLRRADRQGSDFGEHALAVLLMPLLLLLPLITFRLFRQTREIDRDFSKADGSTN